MERDVITLDFESLGDFLSEHASRISLTGMFVRTATPRRVGTPLDFEVRLADGTTVLQGCGTVAYTRGDEEGDEPAGMGLRFDALDDASRALIDRVVAHRLEHGTSGFVDPDVEVGFRDLLHAGSAATGLEGGETVAVTAPAELGADAPPAGGDPGGSAFAVDRALLDEGPGEPAASLASYDDDLTADRPSGGGSRLFVWILVLVALAAAAFLFREPLAAWLGLSLAPPVAWRRWRPAVQDSCPSQAAMRRPASNVAPQ